GTTVDVDLPLWSDVLDRADARFAVLALADRGSAAGGRTLLRLAIACGCLLLGDSTTALGHGGHGRHGERDGTARADGDGTAAHRCQLEAHRLCVPGSDVAAWEFRGRSVHPRRRSNTPRGERRDDAHHRAPHPSPVLQAGLVKRAEVL